MVPVLLPSTMPPPLPLPLAASDTNHSVVWGIKARQKTARMFSEIHAGLID